MSVRGHLVRWEAEYAACGLRVVEVSGGVSSRVTRSTSATVPSGSHDLRPRPFLIFPSQAMPSMVHRARQARIELALTPTRRAIS